MALLLLEYLWGGEEREGSNGTGGKGRNGRGGEEQEGRNGNGRGGEEVKVKVRNIRVGTTLIGSKN